MNSLSHYDLPVLLVVDELDILDLTRLTLAGEGINNILMVDDSRLVLPFLGTEKVAAIVLDLMMPHLSGIDLLQSAVEEFPDIPVIVMTAMDDVETAVECLKKGAFDYLLKPVDPNRLVSVVDKALKMHYLQQEVSSLKDCLLTGRLERADAFSDIITCSNKMRGIFQYAEVIARSRQPILITGETGVGKELMASAIHRLSGVNGTFVAVNIAGLDDAMFSDTLFGHKKGAFTGAGNSRDGLITRATDGTLFLDEIGDLSQQSQVKLLRLLQEREYYPLGSDMVKTSDARIIVATNQDIAHLLASGTFRKDLYYRLCAYQIHIPPLRERAEDIPLLLDHFAGEAAKSLSMEKPALSPDVVDFLAARKYPGNVRELQAVVHDAVIRQKNGQLSLDNFNTADREEFSSIHLQSCSTAGEEDVLIDLFGRFPTIDDVEQYMIDKAMQLANGKRNVAASLLGITRQALHKRIKNHS
jgi:DNA-binding NtrC family response regulator